MKPQLREDNPGQVYSIPQKPSAVISVNEYHSALSEAKNKGQQLRVMTRILSSMGYHSNMDEKLRAKIKPYLEDFSESDEQPHS